jgi:hypothetical protein
MKERSLINLPTDPLHAIAQALPPAALVAAVALGGLSAALSAAGTGPGVAARPREAPAVPPQARAHEAFAAQRYAEAYGRYAALADEGDAGAAWMALTLVSNGPVLFGTEWSATPGQLQRWTALAARHVEQRSALIPVHDRGE